MTNRLQTRRRSGDSGYVMLTLVLIMATMAIVAAVIVPSITFEIKRDREEEMIHRGVQYSRAIRAYYKKLGRYPTKIEDLEDTNHVRFLRKRYKDPLSCKNGKCADFKLLHFGDVQMTLSAMGGGVIPGATAPGMNGAPAGGLNGAPTSPFGASPTSPLGQNQQPGTTPAGTDPSQAGTPGSSDGTGDGTNPPGTGTGTPGSNQLGSGQIIGGPIVGVASISKDNTIREFNHKKKYKDWAFVYDPAQDQGRLITTPYQPQLQGFGQQGAPNVNGQNGSTSGFGNGSGSSFGSSPFGSQNSPNSPTGPGFGAPNPPSSPPPQPQ